MLTVFLWLGSCALTRVHEEKAFLAFMREHSFLYTGAEYHLRFGLYLANSRIIRDLNRAGHSFRCAVNKFAVYTPAEAQLLRGLKRSRVARPLSAKRIFADPPASYDYRTVGAVDPNVRDQGNCGSCWAFSTITAQESNWFLTSGVLLQFSEQNIVDCDTNNDGCDGGWPYLAYEYVIAKQGGKFNLRSDYPYTARDGACKFNAGTGQANLVGYVNVTYGDENDLLNKVYTYGPASVCIDASSIAFSYYSGGIYNPSSCFTDPDDLDHAVAVDGWGVDGATPYWIVRNSWGSSWGEKGYIRMSRNKNNQCGIASVATIPTNTK
jgi:cathepsin L